MLSAVIYDLGQMVVAAPFRAHTGEAVACSVGSSHPQPRFLSNPDLRQVSHFQPAWFAY
jgi:hypothetical protein